ncbi:MAG: ABC transporter permease [Dactylosporangium sp.]|nr:ABC transporter permease [Dactylosporangium sp.]NNJ60825.1 ABC transporter permease [Dactylosporangium sp.]
MSGRPTSPESSGPQRREHPRPSRLSVADIVRVGGVGLRTRPLRVFLSALGIAIGIAAMVSVVGISSSSREDLNQTLRRLGTNLLTVSPGTSVLGAESSLPDTAVEMVSRVGPVESATAVGTVEGAWIYRNDHIPTGQTGSIAVLAARTDLTATLGAAVADGTWLNPATEKYPAVVLGAVAARRLGFGQARPDVTVWLGGRWFTLVGILRPVPLAPEIDSAALVGWDAATTYLNFDGHPTTIYTRARSDAVTQVRSVLAATANPQHPEQVRVSRPSDALAAQQATDKTFSGLLLGLGAVALLVGGVGVANTMVISALERRSEIGLRRSLGATRGQIRTQFLAESLLLSVLGGLGGTVLGVVLSTVYASTRHWPTVVPAWASLGGMGATLVIGVLAGVYPAVRASRMAPTAALAAV